MDVQNSITGHGDAGSSGKRTFLVYPCGASRFLFHLPLGDGIEYSDVEISVDETLGTISVSGSRTEAYRFRIRCFSKPTSVMGADAWFYDPDTGFTTVDRMGDQFTLTVQPMRGYLELPIRDQMRALH
ncbi:MAG: hypothetical protein KBH99_03610, partial [Syntrophobacteraceae bacterium]|nr:hypothetical protein [Syntrophobacteraceae bacterium]